MADAVACTGGRVYTVTDVAAGEHNVTRGSGESGLFLIKVEYADKAKTVTFINDANWAKVNVWAWNDTENFTGGEWPGVEMTEKDANGNYTWSTMGNPAKIIFNDGTNQTPDLEFKDGGVYNSTARVIALNDYTATFKTDGMDEVWAYVWNGDEMALGEWPGTKMEGGNGEFTITINAEEAPKYIIFHNNAGDQTPDWAFEDGKVYEFMLNEYTVTFTTDAGWETVNAYTWSGDGDAVKKYLEWPGEGMEPADNNSFSYTFKAFYAPEKIIFNDGGDNQTPDLAFTNGKAYKWITATPFYALKEGDTFAAGTTVDLGDATITYGVEGGADFGAAGAATNEDYAGFAYMTGGNGENGSVDGGTVYTIKPVYDGTITVGVRLNGGKSFFILEDGESMEGYNGITIKDAANTSYSFPVKAGSTYKVYCTGSKLGFFGFDYQYSKDEPQPVVIENMAIVGDFLGLEATEEDAEPNWNPANGWEMEQDATNAAVWTLTKEFTAEAKKYEYKATANGNWDDYVLPAGDNANFVFGSEEYPAGDYILTFTADTENHTLTLDVKANVEPAAEDIDLTVAEGDIAAALAAATEGKKVGDIIVRLNKDAEYTLGATLTAPNSFKLYGGDATVTVAEDFAGDFITLDGTELLALKADGTESDHKYINSVEVRGVTVKGLQGAVVKDAQKTLVAELVIDYANIQMPAAGKNVLDFNGKGYVGKAVITNSTIWAADMNTGFFAQYGSRPKNVDGDLLQEFDFENNTIVNIANGKNFNNFNQKGTEQNVYTVKNNIFVNCGKDKQVIVGMNAGQTSASPIWDVTGNYFMVGDACTNADEVAKAGQKEGEDIVKNSVEGTLTFADAAAGDFNGTFELAEGAEAPEALGAPVWTITFGAAPIAPDYFLVGNFNMDEEGKWILNDENYKLAKNEEATAEEYSITVNLPANTELKVWASNDTWFPEGDNFTIGDAGNYTIYFRPVFNEEWNGYIYCQHNGEPDGINAVQAEKLNSAVIYNLNGQRVQSAQKGLYIVNGKKVVIK